MSADYDPTDPTEKTPLIPSGGGNDDDDEWRDVDLSQQEVPEEERKQWQFPTDTDPNTTQPFEPKASSTPSGGENIPMVTRIPKEKQGASGGTAETSFIKGGNQDPVTIKNVQGRRLRRSSPRSKKTLHNLTFGTDKSHQTGPSLR